MGGRKISVGSTVLLAIGVLLSSSTADPNADVGTQSQEACAIKNKKRCMKDDACVWNSRGVCSDRSSDASDVVGGLRRKRLFNQEYKSIIETRHESQIEEEPQQQQQQMVALSSNKQIVVDGNDIGDDLARKFFLSKREKLDDIDLTQLIMEMNIEGGSMSFIMTESPTKRPSISPTQSPSAGPTSSPTKMPSLSPTYAPSESTVPTLTSCDNEGTCENRLAAMIYQLSNRVGTVDELQNPNSPQSKASAWIIDECNADDDPIDPCTPSQLVYNEQRYALAVLYFSLSGDGWNAGSNAGLDKSAAAGVWMSGLDYCDWGAGITGDNGSYNQLVCNDNGHVVNLNLQTNNLIGEIPPELGALIYLTSYISFTNGITGPIPTTLGNIAPLEIFDVEFNSMDGNLFQPEFYAESSDLTSLIHFRASSNNFVGSIPSEVGLWTKLQNLWLSENELTGSIPSEIGNLVDMDAILMYKNQLTGTIPSDIGNLDKLTWIDIEGNQLSGIIPEEFFTNLELTEVILRNNLLSGTISDSVSDLTEVITFWVSNNELSGQIPATFGDLIKLDSLELQNNGFSGTVPEDMGSMEALEFLSVGQNDITGTIPSTLFGFSLSQLRVLHLNDNQLSGILPENIGMSPRLIDLRLNDNLLTGTLPIISEGEFLFLGEYFM